jgi:hypothetical protein
MDLYYIWYMLEEEIFPYLESIGNNGKAARQPLAGSEPAGGLDHPKRSSIKQGNER